LNYLKSSLVALQFLTQIPVHFKKYPESKTAAGSLIFYPLIGGLIGLALVAIGFFLADLPELFSAAILLVFWVAITGALHIDGLADSCDAWIGGQGSAARTLEIMKDPCSGPIAVVTVLCTLLLKFSAMVAVLEVQAYWMLMLAPLVARSMLPILLLLTPYVRAGGIGAVLVSHAPRTQVYCGCGLALIFAYLLGNGSIIIMAAVSLYCLRMMMIKRINGITGDTAGASIEIVEAVVLVAIVINLY